MRSDIYSLHISKIDPNALRNENSLENMPEICHLGGLPWAALVTAKLSYRRPFLPNDQKIGVRGIVTVFTSLWYDGELLDETDCTIIDQDQAAGNATLMGTIRLREPTGLEQLEGTDRLHRAELRTDLLGVQMEIVNVWLIVQSITGLKLEHHGTPHGAP